MTIKEFPKEHLESILSQHDRITRMTPQETAFITSENIPSHIQLITLLDVTSFIKRFDYDSWTKEYGWDKVMSADTLATADFETLRNIITAHVRTDRFVQGHWNCLQIKGYLARFLDRLRQLYKDTYGTRSH
jgi:hypothetical protein